MIEINNITGIEEYSEREEKVGENSTRKIFYLPETGKAFLVFNKNTLEIRTDFKLGKLLIEKYESVMRSRYFGKGGIEIVDSGQLKKAELEDLVRLSYNLTKEMVE